MKLKQILPVIISLLFIPVINAQVIEKKDWEQGIAILCKHINIVSLQEQKNIPDANNAVSALMVLNEPFTVENVKELIPVKYSANRKLCDEMKTKLATKMPASKEEAIIYLSGSVFDRELRDFISTGNRRAKRSDLQEVIKGELETLFFAPGYAQDLSVSGGALIDNNPNSGKPQEKNSGPSGFLIFGLDILILILIAGLGFFLYKLIEHNNNEIKKLKKKVDDLKFNKADVTDIASLNEYNESLNKKIQELSESQKRIISITEKRQVLSDQAIVSSFINQSPAADILAPMTEPVKEPVIHTLFLSVPTQDGYFQAGSIEYRTGSSMYMLKTIDGMNGTFSFLRKREAVMTALSSVSSFLRPACTITGNSSIQNIQNIITDAEGTVVKEGDGWRIIDKASVRFE